MDQAGKFSVDFTQAGGDPIIAGFYLLMNAYSDEAARARVAETISTFFSGLQDAAEPISSALGIPEVGGVAAGVTALGLGLLRVIRGSSFRSGSGNGGKPAEPVPVKPTP
jgi:hypothetical protein